MSSSWCTSCCGSCFVSSPPASISNSPYALRHLLALGTILIKLPVEIEHQICDHTHAEDGWHHFKGTTAIPHLSDPEDTALCRALDYLVNGRFIAATYRSNAAGFMDVRIYLIPYDLSNVQGKLRVRKENVLVPARRYLRDLFPRISQDMDRWKGFKPTGEEPTILPLSKDPRTLAEIYGDLPSPHPIPVPGYGNIAGRLLDFQDDLDGFGMRTTLYTYQRRSVAAMLQKELDLQDVPDPLYIPVNTVDKKPFFLQPGTMEVLQERPMSATCRGGILCEELGTGKTIMMLSLIVATRNQLSSPEPSLIDDRPVMTSVAYRHFPSSDFASARKRAGFSNAELTREGANVPPLVELLLDRARTGPYCDIPANSLQHERRVEYEDMVNNLPLAKVIHANVPFYHQYLGEPNNRQRGRRINPPRTPKKLYLTSATLIVVPANLLSQWDREITRHCAIPLRVLILRVKTPMPSVQSLATDYDIILMSYTRLSTESHNQDVLKLHTQQPCECPEFDGFRVPNCTCKVADVSPFLQIRWKRLIIDEGHVSSTLSTTLVPFAKLLSIERRWIVTGTPTTNLLGLSFGNKVNSELEKPNTIEDCDSEILGRSPSSSFSDSSRPSPPALPQSAISVSPPPEIGRIWSHDDRIDLNKLGNMISHFIIVPQFNADPKLIATRVVEPLLDPNGPRPGAIQVLNQVMHMVMIRHRIEDVEQDVVLPPVTQESVLLDLDPYVVKSFNALQANILINAVDSQRTDQDYMFHAHNAAKLQETVTNMSQILFWHVNCDLYYAEELMKHADTSVKRAIERKMPEEDIRGMREAFEHIRIAYEDPIWRSLQYHEDVAYRVHDLNERVYQAWTRTPGKEPNSDPRQNGFLHADRLLKMHQMVIKKPLIKEDGMVIWAQAVAKSDHVFRMAYEESERKKAKRWRKTKRGDDFAASSSASQMIDNFAKKASAAETLAEMRKELQTTMAKLEREEAEDCGLTTSPGPSQVPDSPSRPSSLITSSLLAKMRIGSSASSKLNYIINEVQQHSKDEKFLIFSESALSLAHVSEALELIHVKFLRFTTQVTPQVREQLVLTFETSETYRVFLMELKHGARGLNLVSASRVIFCEPVWQADVESQAIKRAHRIGQTRPITVKTLAIRQTAEENMVARRAALRNSQEKLPKLLEEAGMRYYIANPKFITHAPALTPINKFPLVDLPPELLQPRPGALMLKIPALPITSPSRKRVRVEDPITEINPFKIEEGFSEEESQPPKKKKNKVAIRFATP